jgi:uncharacterized protein YwqG
LEPLRIIVDKAGKTKHAYAHKFGGFPQDISEKELPRCGNCNTHLQLLVQLDTRDPKLKSYDFNIPFVYIYFCDGCDTRWDPMYYLIKPGTVEIVKQSEGDKWELPNTVYPEFPIQLKPMSKEDLELTRREYNQLSGNGKFHRLCETPIWVQYKKSVRCPRCKQRMQFLGQLDSDTARDREDDLMFGDCGALYIHRCIECGILSTFIQSY